MKTLSTDSASLALGVDRKTLDNILAREGRRLLPHGSRGRSRRIPTGILERIAVTLILNRDLGVGIARGLELAGQLIESPEKPIAIGSLSTLWFDMHRLREALSGSVDEALESVAEPIRGRPRS